MGRHPPKSPPGAWRLPTLALLAAAACDSTTELTVPPGTRIVVRVQATDGPTAESLTGVRVEVTSGDASNPWLRERRILGEGERPMAPANLWLLPGPLSLDASQRVRVTGEREGAEPVVQIAEVHFCRGATTLLLMDLFGGCVGRPPCPTDQTCGGGGRCVPIRRDPLPDYVDPTRPPPPFDASAPSDASVDATADGGADAPTATTDAGCAGAACDPLVGLAAGAASTCAWSRDGRVWCWGADVWSSAADGRAVPSPARVADLDGTRSVALSSSLCVVRTDGSLACRPSRSIPASWQRLRGATAVALGRAHACALLGDGAVRCAGDNTSGQSGEALTESPQSLTLVDGLAAAQQVSARGDVSCAVTDGRVACWGTATAGVLGVAETDASLLICSPLRCRGRAEPLPGLADVVRVDARASAEGDPWGLGCAIDRAGAVRCWGTRAYVGLGPGASTETVAPGAAVEGMLATDVQVGERFACALTRDGAVRCWGAADRCRLGRAAAAGTTIDRPADVAISGARAIAVGAAHACALTGDREVRCWGEGSQGQLGDGRSRAADDCAPARVEVPL